MDYSLQPSRSRRVPRLLHGGKDRVPWGDFVWLNKTFELCLEGIADGPVDQHVPMSIYNPMFSHQCIPSLIRDQVAWLVWTRAPQRVIVAKISMLEMRACTETNS